MRRWVSSPAYRVVIEAVVTARNDQGLTQRGLAARLKVDPSIIAKIEIAERRLDLVEFIVLARALGKNPEELLAGIVQKLPDDLSF